MGMIKDPTSWRAGFELGLAGFSFPYSKPRKPVAYLYNGIRLPALPEVSGHGYAVIDDDGEGGTLILFSDIGYYVPDVSASSTVNPVIRGGGAYRFYYNNGNGVWEYQQEITNGVDAYVTNVFWANFDLCYEDGTSYLAASEPIPVYE